MSKFRSRVARTTVGAVAVGAAITVGGAAATHPGSLSSPLVDLSALIVVGSSTHPDPTGNEDFFGGLFNQAPYNPGGQPGADLIGVDFRGGAAAIDEALQANSGEDNAVLSSGWGAANASLLLSRLDRATDPALPTTVFVLDNNVSRPDGGFGTRYPLFALIGVNPFPSPTDTAAAAVVDIAYQYNYNSNAPADLLNVVAHVNSLVAYLYGYREQSEIDLPVDITGRPTVTCGSADTCAVLTDGAAVPCDDARCTPPADDRVVAYVTTRGNTTYVTYTTEELPLTRLIRQVFGDSVADVSAPLLKVIVDSAYYDGNPIPSDPSRYRPARLFPSLGELADTAAKVPDAVREGLESLSEKDSQDSPTPQQVDEPVREVVRTLPTDDPQDDANETVATHDDVEIDTEQQDFGMSAPNTFAPEEDSATEESSADDAGNESSAGPRERRRDARERSTGNRS
ncbi:PE-PPE domain-containing protein [Mycolicibacterium duvalii]|uniref:PE-PPE domain-containing protein n=1 Tax=Mycolicibacterium duvalii TaxID=39688 RepID=UPI001F21829F|nr:PE-PPE domain-containing protein [Mycolicibacterium duvalii]